MNNLNFKMNRCSHCLVGTLYVRTKKLAKLGNQIKVDSTPDDHKFTKIFQFLMVLFFSLSTTNYSFIIIIFLVLCIFLSCYEIFVFSTGNSDDIFGRHFENKKSRILKC